MTDIQKHFSEFIRQKRIDAGRSQKQTAIKLRVGVKRYAAWENGKRKPPIEILPVIASLYEITVDQLLKA